MFKKTMKQKQQEKVTPEGRTKEHTSVSILRGNPLPPWKDAQVWVDEI